MLALLQLSSTIQHVKLSRYHHRCWGQDHPAGSEVRPWFEAQHHVDISAEPLHAWRKKRQRDSETMMTPPECLYQAALRRSKATVISSTAKNHLPSLLGDVGMAAQLVLSEGPGSAPQISLER